MNHPGEIAPLARMARLDVAMITIVAPAHLEAFENIEGIAHEKAAILDGLMPHGHAILPADLSVTPILLAKAQAVGAQVASFGTAATADFRLISASIGDTATVVKAICRGSPVLYKVLSPGRHFALNGFCLLYTSRCV